MKVKNLFSIGFLRNALWQTINCYNMPHFDKLTKLSLSILQEYTFCFCLTILYPPEVSSIKYCCLKVFRKEYFRLVTKSYKWKICTKNWYSWVVKIRNTSEAVLKYPIGLYTDCGPMGQYNSMDEYCNPHTASSVFLILL